MYERVWERKGKGVGEKERGSGERKRDCGGRDGEGEREGERFGERGERGREIWGEGWGSRERSNLPISSLFIVVCIHHMHTPMGWPLAKIYSNLTFVH